MAIDARGDSAAQAGAGHQADEVVVRDLAAAESPNLLAIAQDGERVTKRPHLPQAVRNEDHHGAVGLELSDDTAEPIDIVAGECRCRLVEQQDLGLQRNRLNDLDLLAERQVNLARFHAWIEVLQV
jgi:hypothetical protein